MKQDTAFGAETRLRLDNWGTSRGSFPGRGKMVLFSQKCPGWLWGPPTLLFNT